MQLNKQIAAPGKGSGLRGIWPLLASLSLFCLATQPLHPAPILGGRLWGAGGTVTVTILPSTSSWTSDIYCVSPGGPKYFGTDAQDGRQGSFFAPLGQELVFMINVRDDKWVYFTGAASRNLDGLYHAKVDWVGPRDAIVTLEDKAFPRSGDDYNDVRFLVVGAKPNP
jgi:hypothetical protein